MVNSTAPQPPPSPERDARARNNAATAAANPIPEASILDATQPLPEASLARIPQIATQPRHNTKRLGQPHVCLRLDQKHQAAINTALAQEVLVIPQQRLTVMPNMPAAVMGLLNHRSRIFWVIDLPQLFGLVPLDPRSPEYHLAILRVNDKPVGIAVQQVQGITRFSTENIQSALDNDIAPGLVPYLQGCIPQAEEMLLVLDAAAISGYSGSTH